MLRSLSFVAVLSFLASVALGNNNLYRDCEIMYVGSANVTKQALWLVRHRFWASQQLPFNMEISAFINNMRLPRCRTDTAPDEYTCFVYTGQFSYALVSSPCIKLIN